MNKLYLGGIIFAAAMLLFTYVSISGSEGGINDDIVNMLGVAGAVALVIITVFVVIKYVRQMQTDTATGNLVEHSWDNIGEYDNELPFGWAVSFFLVIVWGMWYFIAGYPVNAYSQIGEYNEDTAAHNAKYEAKYASFTGEKLVGMGESVFLAECKVCHMSTADGLKSDQTLAAANLTHRIDEVAVKHAIVNGANNFKNTFPGGMPAGMAFGADVDVLAKYVSGGFKGEKPAAWAACASCHGENGEGMAYVGPRLNHFDKQTVTMVLNEGKKGAIGTMPVFNNLNAKQKEAVAAYISSLANN